MSKRRVVVTGLGAVKPVGNDIPSTWKSIVAGRSGVAKIRNFDASGFPSQIAGEVKNFDFEPWIQKDPGLKRAMSNTRFALSACDEAVGDSGLDWGNLDARRTGIYYAAGDSAAPVDALARAFHKAFPNDNSGFDANAFIQERLSTGFGEEET